MKPAITDIALADFPKLALELGLKPFVARQLVEWLYAKRVASFDDMTSLSKPVRKLLRSQFTMKPIDLDGFQTASDGTMKFLCRAADGAAVECVLIPVSPPGEPRVAEEGRVTVCISTQAGCSMGCLFCRTASLGLKRNLTQGEILGQLMIAMAHSGKPVTNVVLMGMGEPLANMEAVEGAVNIMLAPDAMGFSKRRVTLSTCGLLPELEVFSLKYDIRIAISLNATTDEVRSRLMPINRRYPIEKIMEFSREYSKRSSHRITFEYVLIGEVNDTKEDAKRLVALLKGVRAKVNLIPLNPFEESDFKAPEEGVAKWWSDYLYSKGIHSNIRISRGQEIMAACGQLAASAAGRVESGGVRNGPLKGC